MLLSFIVVSIFLYLIARISPYEWKKEHDSNKKKTFILTNQFSIRNTFWYIFEKKILSFKLNICFVLGSF
jgi:ABC-type uncharacterized transport system permease subunit